MAKDYDISKASGTCVACDHELSPGEEFFAVLREIEQELRRDDYCLQCWSSTEPAPDDQASDVLGSWRSKVPTPEQKKKLFVDNELLINFFERMEEADDEPKLSFRYVLALVLMRKKLLIYDRMERREDGTEVWEMHFRGSDQVHEVTDPKMDEEKIAEVSGHLGEILEGEL